MGRSLMDFAVEIPNIEFNIPGTEEEENEVRSLGGSQNWARMLTNVATNLADEFNSQYKGKFQKLLNKNFDFFTDFLFLDILYLVRYLVGVRVLTLTNLHIELTVMRFEDCVTSFVIYSSFLKNYLIYISQQPNSAVCQIIRV